MPTGAGSSHAVNRAGGTIRDPLIVQERAPKPSATRIEAGLAPDGAKREVVGRRPMKSVARNTVRVSRLPHGHSRYRLGVIRESRIEGFFGDGLRSTTYHTRHQLLAAPSFPLAAAVACAVREARKIAESVFRIWAARRVLDRRVFKRSATGAAKGAAPVFIPVYDERCQIHGTSRTIKK